MTSLPRPFFARLTDDDRGSIAPLFALMTFVVVTLVGGAVDYGRWLNANNKNRYALDAAVLAGAKVLQNGGTSASAQATAQIYFDEMKADTAQNVSLNIEVVGETKIKGELRGEVETAFLKLAQIDNLAMSFSSGAQMVAGAGSGGDLEIALMLDMTESMCDGAQGPCTASEKLDALKTAAKDLIGRVVWDDQSEYTSRVALVPFSRAVRLAADGEGGDIMEAVTDLPPQIRDRWRKKCTKHTGSNNWTPPANSEGTGTNTGNKKCVEWGYEQVTWKIEPCVSDRSHGQQYTNEAPGADAWLNGNNGKREPYSKDSRDNSTNRQGFSKNDPLRTGEYSKHGKCGKDVPKPNIVMPLSSDKSALLPAIDRFEAYGSTGGTAGTQMTWYMLSPNWSGVWGLDKPAGTKEDTETTDGTQKLRKVAVLMTDGEFNTHRTWKNRDRQDMANRTKELCTEMKESGIEIYTVGLALDDLPQPDRGIAIDMLQSCGTTLEHFYNTLDVDELKGAFASIGNQLSTISLYDPQ